VGDHIVQDAAEEAIGQCDNHCLYVVVVFQGELGFVEKKSLSTARYPGVS
jgi:hypothetical protein